MAKLGRATVAILAGAVAWAVLWNIGTQGAMRAFPQLLQPDRTVTHTGVLLAYIGYSVALSLLAGFVTARTAGKTPMPAVWSLAGLQLALGIGFEVSSWSLTPAWYHLVFLALIVPATVYGGVTGARRRRAAAEFTP